MPAAEPIAVLNGRVVPAATAGVSMIDDGFVQAATVTERIRTFQHRPFRQAEHLDRLRFSLKSTGIAEPSIVDTLPSQIETVLAHNVSLVADWQDLSIVIFVTPGSNRSLAHSMRITPDGPTVGVHTLPTPSPHWDQQATAGARLVTPDVRQLPVSTLDPHVKTRSRLHWFIAARQAQQVDSQATALLLDAYGHVTETSSGNLIVFADGRLWIPRPEGVLGGISQQVVCELAAEHGITMTPRDMTPADVINAEEAFIASTGYCLLPVTRLNGRSIGTGEPGAMYERLIAHWSAVVGVDILAQFRRAADEETS